MLLKMNVACHLLFNCFVVIFEVITVFHVPVMSLKTMNWGIRAMLYNSIDDYYNNIWYENNLSSSNAVSFSVGHSLMKFTE